MPNVVALAIAGPLQTFMPRMAKVWKEPVSDIQADHGMVQSFATA